jgi:hypothetical protein
MRITNGATIILLLSKNALGCQRVQRTCLVRAAALSEHRRFITAVPGRAESSMNEGLVLVNADRLGFEFPEPEFYENLLIHHPHLSMAPEDSPEVNVMAARLRRQDCPQQSARWGSSWDKSSWTSNRDVNERFAWSRLDLPYESDEQCAVVLQAFYKSMLSQIALPLSTHGSWKAIKQQVYWIYERSVKIPTIYGLAARSSERGLSPSRSGSRTSTSTACSRTPTDAPAPASKAESGPSDPSGPEGPICACEDPKAESGLSGPSVEWCELVGRGGRRIACL